jgi:actin-related protein
VVFDLGSYSCKVGYASSNHNEVETLSVLGFPKTDLEYGQQLIGKDDLFIGADAIIRSPLLNLKYPIE